DPGVPDIRSPLRYLWWNARRQSGALLAGIAFATTWWLAQALVPAVLGKGIDALRLKDTDALLAWSAILLGLGLVQAFTGIMRHRFAVYNWLAAAYRTVQLTTRQAARLGATLSKRLSTGEVVSVGNSDIAHIGGSMDILLRGVGSVVAIAAVTVILITTSPVLRLMVQVRRHRGRPAGAPRHRRRAGLRRPLPRGVAAGPPRGRRRGPGGVAARRLPDRAARPAHRARHQRRRRLRGRRPHHGRPARHLL